MDYKQKLIEYTNKLYLKANQRNTKSKFIYLKIISSLQKYDLPICGIDDLKGIKNIGPKTLELFKNDVFEREMENDIDIEQHTNCSNNLDYLEKCNENHVEKNKCFDKFAIQSDDNLNLSTNDRELLNFENSENYKQMQKEELTNNEKNVKKRKCNLQEEERCKKQTEKLISVIDLDNSINEDKFNNLKDNVTFLNNSFSEELKIVDKNRKQSKKKTKEYIPAYKTGPYAILKVLNEEDGLSKHIICHRGNKYSNSEFNVNSRNSAWVGIKTLLKKQLVLKESKKYYITELGKELAKTIFNNESTIHNTEENVYLVIDSREMKSKNERNFFQSALEKETLCKSQNIELGDFIWIVNETVLNYIVERKKGSDFCSSIADGRYNDQKRRLKSLGVDNIYYIIEGLKESDMNKLGINRVLKCLSETKNEGFTVIETENIDETVEVLKILDSHIRLEHKKCTIFENEIKKFKLDDYIDKGNKNINLTVKDVFLTILLSIRGLSYKKAKLIADKYNSFRNFVESENWEEQCKNFEIGNKIILRIKKMIFGD